jgi:hypothetical protein
MLAYDGESRGRQDVGNSPDAYHQLVHMISIYRLSTPMETIEMDLPSKRSAGSNRRPPIRQRQRDHYQISAQEVDSGDYSKLFAGVKPGVKSVALADRPRGRLVGQLKRQIIVASGPGAQTDADNWPRARGDAGDDRPIHASSIRSQDGRRDRSKRLPGGRWCEERTAHGHEEGSESRSAHDFQDLAERPPWVAVSTPYLPDSVVGFVVHPLPILEDDGHDTGERHATDYDTSVALPCSIKSQLWRRPSVKVPKIG